MDDMDVKFLNVKISTFYFTDILGKEVSETLVDEYDKIMRKAKKMRVPKDESDAYFVMVEQLKKLNSSMNYPPAKLRMQKNLKKFAKKMGITYDLMPYFFIAIFERFPNKNEVLLDLVLQVAIEFVALILILKKKKNLKIM